jgi:outer membrane protein TolC
MKKLYFILCLLTISISIFAQDSYDDYHTKLTRISPNKRIIEDYKKTVNFELPPLSVFMETALKHSTMKAYETRMKDARARTRIAKRNWLNWVTIVGQYQYGRMSSVTGYSDFDTPLYHTSTGSSRNQYFIGVNLAIPLGDIFGGQAQLVKTFKIQEVLLQREYETSLEQRKITIMKAYNDVIKELATLKAKSEAAALYEAQMHISESDFVNGKIDIISLSLERGRRTGAVVTYETAKASLHNAITMLELLTNVKIIK